MFLQNEVKQSLKCFLNFISKGAGMDAAWLSVIHIPGVNFGTESKYLKGCF
jgi:hypothetical protein